MTTKELAVIMAAGLLVFVLAYLSLMNVLSFLFGLCLTGL